MFQVYWDMADEQILSIMTEQNLILTTVDFFALQKPYDWSCGDHLVLQNQQFDHKFSLCFTGLKIGVRRVMYSHKTIQ